MMCPCKDCEERHPACHGKCKKYIEWKKEEAEKKEIRKKEMPVSITVGSFLGNAISSKKHRRL